MMSVGRFCIRADYKHRESYAYFDDTPLKDEWQKEVYIRAKRLAEENGVKAVYDVGCGSAFKLMKHFEEYQTIGFDVPETIPFLRRTYPDRVWKSVPFSDRSTPPAELVICADVIEHVPDPSELLEFLRSIAARWVVLSTPDRELVYDEASPYRLGPPGNPTHIREWTFDEFEKYISAFFTIKEHEITNREQATQMIVATTWSASTSSDR
jgi:hypothetical protein